MVTASFNGETIAKSNKVIHLEGNIYFPRKSVNMKFLSKSDEEYACPWKGECSYYNVKVKGKTSRSAAWSYETPKLSDKQIKN